ncbi:unnamed protein product [Dovyalis caffra]|uniref:Uncharacterized protein n=1 Tax=Dovyalis caffra TaxID=77055 RepID=A0AAV1RXY9_9ROSI|nr:unnamed protein product [Dovyalis caffra]
MPNSAPRPSPFGQPPPFPSSAPSPQFSRPGAPPPGVVPRPSMPPSGSPPSTFPPNVAPGRPIGPPFSQPQPFGSRPPPGSFPSSASSGLVTGPVSSAPPHGSLALGARASPAPPSSLPLSAPHSSSFGGLVNNGPPAPAFQSAPRFPPPVSAPQQPPMGPPPTMGVPVAPFSAPPQGTPFSAPSQGTPFSAQQGMTPPPIGSPFAPHMQQPWRINVMNDVVDVLGSRILGRGNCSDIFFTAYALCFNIEAGNQVEPQLTVELSIFAAALVAQPPSIPGSAQPPRMFGMPPPLPNQMTAISPVIGQTGSPLSGTSKIDPNQIPRPIPGSSVILHDTRAGNQANPPPPATSEYIATDTGNCSPRYMRCTINQIPCTVDLLSTSGMQLALLVQPLALPHPSEDPVQVVDFGDSGPVRCSRCKGYINPFMKFIDQGRRFIFLIVRLFDCCQMFGFASDLWNLKESYRSQCLSGSVRFTDETPRDYHCNLGPDGRRRDADERPELCRGTVEFAATREYMVRDPMPAVYFFLVDVSMHAIQTGATAAACSSISQVIADLPEGPRTMVGIATFDSTIHFYNLKRALQQPLMLIVPDIHDVYTPLQTDVIVPVSECRQHLELLLESIPSMFQSTRIAESAFSAAIKAAFLAMKNTGGKLLYFDDSTMLSVLPSVGIGALSAREAEGRSNISAGEKEAHKLLQPADKTLKEMAIEFAEYQVCVDVFLTTQTYVDIASISVIPKTTGGQVYYYYPFSAVSDPPKLYNDLRWNVTRPQGFEAVMRVRCSQGVQVQEYHGNFCKRIPTDIDLAAIDCDKTIMVTLKHDDKLQDGSECAFQCALLYTTVYGQRRIRVANLSLPCTNNLSNLFRLADLDSQFVCFLKQAANEIPSNPPLVVRERLTNFCINILLSYRKFCATVSSSGQLILPEALKLLPLVYSLLDTLEMIEANGSHIPPALPLSSEYVSEDGIYLLENGQDGSIYIGNSVNPDILQKLFGISSVAEIPTQFVLEQYDNPLSKKLNDVVNEIRRQRCSFLRLKLCKKGDPSGEFIGPALLCNLGNCNSC